MPFIISRHLLSSLSMLILSSLLLSGCASEEEKQIIEKQSVVIEKLQENVSNLQKQMVIINRNQQAIAQKVGLAAPAKQPSLTVGSSASLGDKNARVILIELTDLHCPFCKRFNNETFPALSEKYIEKGVLRFVGKHLPIPALHPNAFFASELLECSRAQSDDSEGYEKVKSWLFEQGKQFDKSQTEKFSSALGLDNTSLTNCLNDGKVSEQIKNDMLFAKKIGIKSTPSFVIGLQKEGVVTDWKTISGAKSVAQFSQVIDQYLAK